MNLSSDVQTSDCLYCDVETNIKISPITFVCQDCLELVGLERQMLLEFHDKEKRSTWKSCAACRMRVGRIIDPHHTLGQFHYCIDCIDKGDCKCIICTSTSLLHKICNEWMNYNRSSILQPKEDPYDKKFVASNLTTREIHLMMEIINHPNEHYVILHSGNSWIDIGAIAKKFVLPDDPIEKIFKVILNDIPLEQKEISYYANIMSNHSRTYIISHFEGNDRSVAETIQSFANDCWFNAKVNGETRKTGNLFMKGQIFFLIGLDPSGDHWLVGKFLKHEQKFHFITTSTTDCSDITKIIIDELKSEWEKIEHDREEYNITLVDEKLNLQYWPNTEDKKSDYAVKNCLYAVFLLRNWVYDLSSDISEKNENKMLTYFVLSGLHRSPMYFDDGHLPYNYLEKRTSRKTWTAD